jgi:hypothetical protein
MTTKFIAVIKAPYTQTNYQYSLRCSRAYYGYCCILQAAAYNNIQ